MILIKYLVPNVYNESETITKFEIMDGAPVRGKLNNYIHVYIITIRRRNNSYSFIPWWI